MVTRGLFLRFLLHGSEPHDHFFAKFGREDGTEGDMLK